MLVFTPIDLPKIEPDNWDIFWDIWNSHSSTLIKVKMNADSSIAPLGNDEAWKGLDIFKRVDMTMPWAAPFFDIKERLPKMYNTIQSLSSNVLRARVVESKVSIPAHTDDDKDRWNIRAFLYGKDIYKQWYFTKPHDPKGDRVYINMPEDTNWFMYNDLYSWHGTDFDPNNKKILLQIYLLGNPSVDYITSSLKKYKDYAIEF